MKECCSSVPTKNQFQRKTQKPSEYLKNIFRETNTNIIDKVKNIYKTDYEESKAVKIISAINKSAYNRDNLNKNISHFRINISEILEISDCEEFVGHLEEYRSIFNEILSDYKINVSLLKYKNYKINEGTDFFFIFNLPVEWYRQTQP